ncbi:MAG TPA: hypothetical protein VFT53_07525 [Candidatus Saccharimonadales bacterium]|nr:hypothetical protein [Candidatus Saccharimonadales bacterium]
MSYNVDLCQADGSWPPAVSFVTDNVRVASLFDGFAVTDIREAIAKYRTACDEMEAKADELGL